MFDLISSILLLIIPFDILLKILKREKDFIKKYISYFSLSLGLNLTLKLIFRFERNYIDPFSFPSTHSSISIIPFFVYERIKYKIAFLFYAILIGTLRILAGLHSFIEVLFGYIFSFLAIILFNFFEKMVGNDIHRKSMHIGLGSFIGYIFFIKPFYTLIFLIILLYLGFLLYLLKEKYFVNIFLEIYSKDKSGIEAFVFILGILLASIIIYPLKINPFFSAIYLSWVDGLSTIFGRIFNKKDKKSIYGLFGGFLGGIIALLATKTNPIFAIILPIIEYLTRNIDDNLVLPISSILIYILLFLVSSKGLLFLSPEFPFHTTISQYIQS